MKYDAHALLDELSHALYAKRFVVAFSGGLDSVVLLHSVKQLELPQPIVALHINHRMNDKADDWQRHCEALSLKLGVECFSRVATVKANGTGIEDAARNARYGEFAEFLENGDVLLMAHHLNDQAETFLLRLMRGSGPRGLAGMPHTRQLGEGNVYRPLLRFSRRDLERYAEVNNLEWVDDDTNENEDFDRNFIRKQVVEPLKERWPSMLQNVTRSARLSREAEDLNKELASIDLFACYPRDERWGFSIALTYLKGLSRVRQKNTVRYWIDENDLPLPGHARLQEIVDNVIHAAIDAKPLVEWDNVQCRRYNGRLYLITAPIDFAPLESYELTIGEFLNVPGMGEISLASDMGYGMRIGKGDKVNIRFRHGGERCKPEGRRHSQKLKKLFQEMEVPPWIRDRTPLVYINDELACVGDFWINEGYGVGEKEKGFVLGCYYDLRFHEPGA